MIAGEIEYIYNQGLTHDNFSLFGKRKKGEKKKGRAKELFNKAKQGLQDIGGAGGAKNVLNGVKGMFGKGKRTEEPVPEDYTIGIGTAAADTEDEPKEKNNMVPVLIVGGLLVAGVIYALVRRAKLNSVPTPIPSL